MERSSRFMPRARGYRAHVAGARFTIEGDGRTGRCSLDGMVSGIEVRVATTIIERHLDGLDVLIVDGDGVTAADGTATRAIAALCAACRPKGVAFVVRPSAELLAALDLGDFGEHLCAGVSAGDVWTSTS